MIIKIAATAVAQTPTTTTPPLIYACLCVPKPFEVFPEFDVLVYGVVTHDRNGHVLYHQKPILGTSIEGLSIVLTRAGYDRTWIHFLSAQTTAYGIEIIRHPPM